MVPVGKMGPVPPAATMTSKGVPDVCVSPDGNKRRTGLPFVIVTVIALIAVTGPKLLSPSYTAVREWGARGELKCRCCFSALPLLHLSGPSWQSQLGAPDRRCPEKPQIRLQYRDLKRRLP
jgi:hypothetical protein